MKEQPRISCIMPTYGRPAYINEQVKMFLDQDYENKELIILNDCKNQKYISKYPEIKVINVEEKFKTLGEKRNRCIEESSGEYIAVWDDDDCYLPWRLSYSLKNILEDKLNLYRPEAFWSYWGGGLTRTRANLDYITHSSVIYTKDIWDKVGGYPHITHAEDRELFLKIQKETKTGFYTKKIQDKDMFYVLRGFSEYTHICGIGGGKNPLDTSEVFFEIAPAEVSDPMLNQQLKSKIKGML